MSPGDWDQGVKNVVQGDLRLSFFTQHAFADADIPAKSIPPGWLIALILAVATMAVFYPVYEFEFIHYDDNAYITENAVVLEGLTGGGAVSAFAEGHNSSWHPLAMLSHMIDVELFGLEAGRHHLVNAMLHVLNTILLFAVFSAMTGQRVLSGFVAAIFALHPLHVEPVAWISSRKDVLSTTFMLVAIGAYLRYVSTRSRLSYIALALLFALGLLAKPMLVTFPFLLLLLDIWPLGRVTRLRAFQRLVIEKVPLFMLAAAAIAATVYFQTSGGAVQSLDTFPLEVRWTNSAVSYVDYLSKTFWPAGLAPYYPHPGVVPPRARIGAGALVLAAVTIVALALSRRWPQLLVGWLWFVGMLVPVIGLVQFGTHRMADRYTYVPLIGLSIAVIWLIADLSTRLGVQRLAACAGIGLAGVLATVSARQLRHWENDVTLFTHAVAVTPPNPVAENKLGYGLQAEGRLEEAMLHFERALELEPRYVFALNNLGAAYAQSGDLEAAERHFRRSLEVAPHGVTARVGLGQVLEQSGDQDGAFEAFAAAVEGSPRDSEACFHLGRAVMQRGKPREAVTLYRRALENGLDTPEVHINLGNALVQTGNLGSALEAYDAALELDPRRAVAHLNIASALMLYGRGEEAKHHLARALELDAQLEPARMLLESLQGPPGPRNHATGG